LLLEATGTDRDEDRRRQQQQQPCSHLGGHGRHPPLGALLGGGHGLPRRSNAWRCGVVIGRSLGWLRERVYPRGSSSGSSSSSSSTDSSVCSSGSPGCPSRRRSRPSCRPRTDHPRPRWCAGSERRPVLCGFWLEVVEHPVATAAGVASVRWLPTTRFPLAQHRKGGGGRGTHRLCHEVHECEAPRHQRHCVADDLDPLQRPVLGHHRMQLRPARVHTKHPVIFQPYGCGWR
jgi:hypothetical protein